MLKASPSEQARLLDLQAIDQKLAQLEHRRRNLPEYAELNDLAQQQQKIRNDLVTAQTDVSDIAREQDKLESDIDQVRQRMGRDQQRLDAGSVSSAKELESLQHEIGSLSKRQRDLEDVELEVMERLEVAEGQALALAAEQDRLARAVEDAERRRAEAVASIDKDVDYAQRQRETVVPDVAEELLALYEKLRAQLDGLAVVAIKQRRCDGCRLELSATDLGHVRTADEDEILRCEECRRIQVRTDESGL
ncbi:MAG TPA: C4-type zinc ribbon domain-containing protein [Actinomycetes bacterium]|nr:C4-type zinc ribbon domain-containing protein [Actinomycetes bacterium]